MRRDVAAKLAGFEYKVGWKIEDLTYCSASVVLQLRNTVVGIGYVPDLRDLILVWGTSALHATELSKVVRRRQRFCLSGNVGFRPIGLVESYVPAA